MFFKNVAGQKFVLFAFDSLTNLPKPADAANLTAYVSKDFGAVTALGDPSATEMDATNAKGFYLFDAAQAETNGDVLLVSGKSNTPGVVVVGAPAVLFPVTVDANKYPKVDVEDFQGAAPLGQGIAVDSGGHVGVNWANISNQNATVNLSGTTIQGGGGGGGGGADPWLTLLPGAYTGSEAGALLDAIYTTAVYLNALMAGDHSGFTATALAATPDPLALALPGTYGAGTAGKALYDTAETIVPFYGTYAQGLVVAVVSKRVFTVLFTGTAPAAANVSISSETEVIFTSGDVSPQKVDVFQAAPAGTNMLQITLVADVTTLPTAGTTTVLVG